MSHNNYLKRDEANKENFNVVVNLIKDLNYCIFFGTLLGFIRENNIIKSDDDIDFLIEHSDIDQLIEILTNNGFSLSGKKDYFLSFFNKKIKEPHTIDFYIYYLNQSSITIPTSIYGNSYFKLKRHNLVLDQKLFFPIIVNNFGVKIPYQSKDLVKILYGKRWSEQLTKNKDYFIYFIRNKPYVTYNSLHIKFLYFFRLISEARLVKARRFLLNEFLFKKN